MANDGAQSAIERLQRAFHRVEAATERLKTSRADHELEARHQRLQDEVEAAIADLDRLIGTAEAS